MSQKRYTKEVFIRSLLVTFALIVVAFVITSIIMQAKKNEIINNVKVSAEYITDKIEGKLKMEFADSTEPAFILAKRFMSKDRINDIIGEDAAKQGITGLSLQDISIWARNDAGEIVNKYSTNSRMNGTSVFGLNDGEVIDEHNVKDYFTMKIENKWLAEKFDTISGFQIEDINSVLKNKIRENIHAVRQITIGGKNYVIDLNYSKRSIIETRYAQESQKVIVIALFLVLVALTVFSLIFDRNMLMHMLVAWILIFTVYPIAWVIGLSFKSNNSLGGTNLNPIPANATVDNYKAALFNMKMVKEEGLVLTENQMLDLNLTKNDPKEKDPIVSKNIKNVYNVFDEEKKNLWPNELSLVPEKIVQEIEYNGEVQKLENTKYLLKFKDKPNVEPGNAIYNVEYYKNQNAMFISGLLNSIFVAFATAIVGMILSSAAGYAFSRFRFPGRDGFMMSFLVTQMFPGTMMLIPLYVIFSNLGMINTFKGLILAYSITALPFNIWNLKGFFDTIPKELEEAALIDGCSATQTFYIIVLPLSLPALAISSLFSFMGAWNEYITAATFINEESKYTIPVVIKMLVSSNSVDWPMFATMSVLVSIPVVIVFLMSQKYLVGGLTAGGVKG